ncbi:MAG: TonB-dependent receptor, partial [Planctomycetes bacterium]|nr:TonB-dependent receptor [Planctomycetota bacterium]
MPAWRQVVFGLAVAGLPGAAGAEEPRRAPRQGPTVVVTATRGPTEASRSGATSSVVTGDEIEAAHHIETQDALRAVPGLHFVKTANRGGTTSLFLRGGESDYTSILIDGFRINVDGGSFDFENLTNDGVDRIEVVRGAGSTLYGSDAMAGVVNVLTRRGEGPPTATVSSEAGSFGILRERLRFEAGEGEAAYAIDLSHLLQDDGRYENSDFRDFSFSGRFDQRMSETTTLTLLQRSLRSTLGVFTTSAGQRFDVPDPNDTKKRNDSLTGLTVTCVPEPDWESTLKVSRYLYETKFDTREDRSRGAEYSDTSSSTNLTDFERLGIDWQNAYAFGDDERIVAGGAFEQDTLLRATAVPGAATSSEVDDSRGTVSGFAQVDWGFDGRLFLTLGGRVDNSSDFETAATQRQAVAWLLEGGTRLRASHGTGIKAPTFFEIHGSGTVPGLATRGILDPETEKSRTLDGGVDRPFWGERGNFSLTGFYNRYEDLVELESSAIGYSQGGEAFSR